MLSDKYKVSFIIHCPEDLSIEETKDVIKHRVVQFVSKDEMQVNEESVSVEWIG